MKKPLVISGIVIFLVIGGVLLFPDNTAAPKKNNPVSSNTPSATSGSTSSKYLEFSNEVFNQAVTNRRVLFFYASWCPTCRPTDASFKTNSDKIPEDLTLIRINYNDPETDQDEKNLAQKYNITYQHTFVLIDSQGKEIKKWNGGGIKELLENTQ